MARFRDAFSEVVLDAVARHVEEAPCVSLIADKVTVNGRTIDITGIITIVPDAPSTDIFQSFVIGAPVVKNHDGTSLARQWLKTAANANIKETRKLAAICTDGQYHHNSVPSKFLSHLTATHPDLAARSEPPCVPCLWDGAHLLNLADVSARAEAGCAWVQETVDAVTRITKRCSFGKSRQTLQDISEEESHPLRGLQLWSETRFAPYAGHVLECFVTNMPAMSAALAKQLDSRAAGNNLLEDMRLDLRLLTGIRAGLSSHPQPIVHMAYTCK